MTKLTRIISLRCAVCGAGCRGRQWHNRDKGYGICRGCVTWLSKTSSAEDIKECYGERGVHYAVPDQE